jgi:quercetin dioxygenase-like cupin family protein
MPAMLNHTTTATPRPVIGRPEQARTHQILGGSTAIRLDHTETGDALGLVELAVPAGYPGPPMHVHPDFDETFYVISGEVALRIGEDAHTAGPGAVAFVPRGTAHTFAIPGSAPARFLALLTPGGFERYFDALAEAFRSAGGIPAPEELATLGIAHGSLPA